MHDQDVLIAFLIIAGVLFYVGLIGYQLDRRDGRVPKKKASTLPQWPKKCEHCERWFEGRADKCGCWEERAPLKRTPPVPYDHDSEPGEPYR